MSISTLIACASGRARLPAGLPFEAQAARRHGLGPLAHSLGAPGFDRDFIAAGLMHEHQAAQAREAIEAIAVIGVPVLIIKGMSAALRHYDDAAERPMTDIDLLVAPDAHAEARRALRRLGYWVAGEASERGRFHHAATLKRAGGAIDLHRGIVQPLRRGSVLDGLWSRARPCDPVLGRGLVADDVDECLITLAHIARHELAVRALSYVDAARMLAAIDRAELEARARNAKLWRGVRLAIAVTDALAGAANPASIAPLVAEVLAQTAPNRSRQLARKLALLEGPGEAARLAANALLEALGL